MTALTILVAASAIILVIAAHILLITLLVEVLKVLRTWPARAGLVIVFVAVLVLFDGTLLLRIWGPQ